MGVTRISQHHQWTVYVVEEGNYNIYNLDPNNRKKRFFEVVMTKPHGQPVIVAEPDLAFDAPVNLLYLNAKGDAVKPDQKIAGIICQNGPRFSLSNALAKGVLIKVNEDGSIQVGEEKWWLASLFSKDKNRIIGYDAFCVREQPQKVTIRELGDLNLFY